MTFAEAFPLKHSWPVWEAPGEFELGRILNCLIADAVWPTSAGEVGPHHAGLWECDLSDNSLTWSGGVYDIFGIARGVHVARNQAVALYAEHSRVAMERLRAHAIKHRRGFTIDVQIQAICAETRSMRLIAAPICDGKTVTHLQGLKLLI